MEIRTSTGSFSSLGEYTTQLGQIKEAAAGKIYSVLVTEDHPLNLHLALTILGGAGYETDYAVNGEEALDKGGCDGLRLGRHGYQHAVAGWYRGNQEN
jgi:hypothetical protein